MRQKLNLLGAMQSITPLRLLLISASLLVLTGFDACNDDPLLDSEGGTGCAGSHCSARILPDEEPNPSRF
jgi:hypothetical protein